MASPLPANDNSLRAHHSLIVIEHDPILYEDSTEMVEYITQALKQASHEATVLLYSHGIEPSWKTFLKVLIEYFTLRKNHGIHQVECQDVAEKEDQKNFGGVLMIWSRERSVGSRIAPDVVNPRMLELEVPRRSYLGYSM